MKADAVMMYLTADELSVLYSALALRARNLAKMAEQYSAMTSKQHARIVTNARMAEADTRRLLARVADKLNDERMQ